MTLQERIDELVAQHGSLRAVARVTEIAAIVAGYALTVVVLAALNHFFGPVVCFFVLLGLMAVSARCSR